MLRHVKASGNFDQESTVSSVRSDLAGKGVNRLLLRQIIIFRRLNGLLTASLIVVLNKSWTLAPREGAALWFDRLAIPADAKNPDAALKFINYILEPKVIAPISDYVAYANPNKPATPLVDPEITGNPGIYPSPETLERLWVADVLPQKVLRTMTRSWSNVKTGK